MTTATALAPLIGLVVIEAPAVKDFLAFGLPSLLAPGNLPALSPRLQLRVVGDPATLAALQRSPAIVRTGARFAAVFVPQAAAAVSWEAALADREIRGLPVLRLDPRIIWSNGALPAVAALLDSGMARVEAICLPVGYDVARPALAERDAAATSAAALARLAAREAREAGNSKRRPTSGGWDFYRRIAPSRFAVHTTDWQVVGDIAGGEEQPVAFLDDPDRALFLRLGRRTTLTRAALIRQLAASRPARTRFRQRFEFGEGSAAPSNVKALDGELKELHGAVDEALAQTRRRLLIAAWTRPYIELFLRLTLPSLTSPGNLPRLESVERRLPATMLTLAADRATCEQSPAFRAFARQRAVEWHCIDDAVAIFGDAREAILSRVFRQAMARHWDPDADLAFLLIRPGHVLADGTLSALVRPVEEGARAVLLPTPRAELGVIRLQLEDGARGASARNLARAVIDGAIEEALPLPIDGRMVRAVSDHVAIKQPGRLAFHSARWHPALLRPARPPQPRRQSLIDMEIVPELAADADEVRRIASSDEALIVDVRTPAPVNGAELVTVGELAKRIGLWATDWHRRNMEATYDLIASDDGTAATARLPVELTLAKSAPAVPARRHPAWLAARGMTVISRQTGESVRYTSDLDGYYRVARLAIENTAAEEVIYAGHASHVFAPLLARCFPYAYLAKIDHLLADPGVMRDPQRSTLYVLHLDLALFQSLCLSGRADRFFREPAASGQPILLIVESPDGHGGLIGLDVALTREWDARIGRLADALGMQARLQSTLIEFFEGHPGFVVQISAKRAPVLSLSAPQSTGDAAASAAPQMPVSG